MEQLFYLFASLADTPDKSSEMPFYQVRGESTAKSLCALFTREYADENGRPAFHFKPTALIPIEEQVLHDEWLECLTLYDDPDPGIYDPAPPRDAMTLAQYGQRATKWEQLLRERTRAHETPSPPNESDPPHSDSSADAFPEGSGEDTPSARSIDSSSIDGKKTLKRTVVEIDLVGYSTISLNIEDSLDVSSVGQLNQQIQSLIDTGLKALNASRDQNVMVETGDGAILVFESALDAHRFAEAVHETTREHNRTRKHNLTKRIFRVGIASGDIVVNPRLRGGFDIAGTTIARAVRLEAKAQPGGCLVDEATYTDLPIEKQSKYGAKLFVSGKRDEKYEAYACQLNIDGPNDASFFIEQSGDAANSNNTSALSTRHSQVSSPITQLPSLSTSMRRQIKNVSIRSVVASEVERVLGHEDYPKIMSLGGNLVDNPIWADVTSDERIRLTTSYRPGTDKCPLFLALDLFLIRANNSAGAPLLLTHYDDRQAGWQAFLFPFRKRMDKETPAIRNSSNLRQIVELFKVPDDSLRVSSLGRQYLVSVKPHPGYSELYAYVFEFCAVELRDPPAWLAKISCKPPWADDRLFRWFQLKELQARPREWHVNADVIRAVTHFFMATKVKIPESVREGFVR